MARPIGAKRRNDPSLLQALVQGGHVGVGAEKRHDAAGILRGCGCVQDGVAAFLEHRDEPGSFPEQLGGYAVDTDFMEQL